MARLKTLSDEQMLDIFPSVFCDCPKGQIMRKIRIQRSGGWQAFQRRTAEANALAAKQRKERLFIDADVPERFKGLDLQIFARKFSDAGKKDAVAAALHFKEHGKLPKSTPGQFYYGLYLYGGYGVGKTSILAPVFTKWADALGGGLWLPFLSFMDEVRNGYNDNTAHARIHSAMTAPIILIDDFGSVSRDIETAHTTDTMWQIIHHRNGHNLPTLITSNLQEDQASSQFNEGLIQRMRELMKCIRVGGKVIREG